MDNRLLGEDDFFDPRDLGFVTQPAPTSATGMYEGFTPEALAYVTRPGALERRVGDVRDVLADDFQLYKQLGQTGDTWGGKTTTYQAYDPYGIAGQTFNVKESGLEKGLQTFGQMAAPLVLTAGMGTALGNALGLTGQTATSIGNALVSGAVTGDPTKAITAGLGSFAAPYLNQLGSAAGQTVGGGMLGDIASRAVSGAGTSALGAAVRGQDIGQALLAGGLGGATGAATSGLTKELGLPEPVARVGSAALTSALLGKDPKNAAVNAIIGELMRGGQGGDRLAGPSELSKTTFLDPNAILQEPLPVGLTDQDLIESILGPQLAGESELSRTEFLKPENILREETALVEPEAEREYRFPVQNFGVAPQSDINEVYNRIMDERGGFASTWQTVGSDRVMVQDDGSAIGLNTETGETYGLTPEETQRMVDAGLLNTETSGYGEAIRGAAPAPAAKPPTAKTPGTKAPGTPSKGVDLAALLAAMAAMGQKPEAAEPYQLANVAPGVQAGLKALEQMYGRG